MPRIKATLLLLINVGLTGACSFATAADELSPRALTAQPTEHWLTNGGSLLNQRYSPLKDLNKTNVANLKGVWHTHLRNSGNGPQHSGEAQPLVYQDVAYIVTGADDVFAIDLNSGNIQWQYAAQLPATMTTVCCGWTSRGVGLSEQHIYVGQLDGQLKALNRQTGEVVWSVQAESWQQGYTITAAPLYYDGLVIVGFAGGEMGTRGRLKAFDANTGKLVWTFYTIPAPGEPGSDTWNQGNMLWMHGGAPIWNTPAIDPELGMLYFSTGNAAANSNGAHRAGDNLFTDSIIALDVKTGTYRWHFQEVHHDIWDYDTPNPVMLFDIEIGGVKRQAVTQAGKTGWFYLLDRLTGAPLLGIDEKPVPQDARQATAATQPYPRGDAFVPQSLRVAPEGLTLINDGSIFTPYWKDSIPIAPGAGGGANWPPSAHDPSTGISYVCASDRPFLFAGLDISDAPPKPGDRYTAGIFLGEAMYSFGVIAAVDMHTNTLVWQQHLKEPCFSGMTATAGGLVFVGRNDGRLTALDNSTGNKLWEFQTGAGMNAPVTVFEHNDKTHVLAYAAGNVLAGSAHGDSLWLFSVDGSIAPETSAADKAVAVDVVDVAPGTADLAAGKQSFETACLACHGVDGKSGHGGADLTVSKLDARAIAETIARGRKNMPPFSAIFSAEQLRDVAGYVSNVIVPH
jgi:quinohemoprotein ethanol dehydrogenase